MRWQSLHFMLVYAARQGGIIVMNEARIGSNAMMDSISHCVEQNSDLTEELINFSNKTEDVGEINSLECYEQELFSIVREKLERINSRSEQFLRDKELERLEDFIEKKM